MASREPFAAGDDPLDRLLSAARWPEAEPERVARLRRHWFDLRRLGPRGPLLSAAVAASLLLSSGTACWRWAARPEPILRSAPAGGWAAVEAPAASNKPGNAVVESTAILWSGGFTSRVPTLYEQVLTISSRPGAADASAPSAGVAEAIDLAALEFVLSDLADCPGADVASLIACLPGDHAAYEQALWGILGSPRPNQWEPAVRVLAEIGTWRSLPVLAHWSARPETHDPAMRGLARLADPRMLTRLALDEPDRTLRRQLLRGLLDRGTPDAVRLYLNFVRRAETAADALAAARHLNRPPVDQLFAVLQGPDVSARLAAARVLGRLNQPEITQRLARMATDNICRQEALVGLLSSPRFEASVFVQQARQDLSLMAAVRAAEWQLQVFGTRNGGKAS
jgi:hypothetical protein